MLDLDKLHRFALARPCYRRAGKSIHMLVTAIQSLEVSDCDRAAILCGTLQNAGRLLGNTITLCRDLDIKVVEVRSSTVKTEFGTIMFIASSDTMKTEGLHAIVFKDYIYENTI